MQQSPLPAAATAGRDFSLAGVTDVDAVVDGVVDSCRGLADHLEVDVDVDVDFDAASLMIAAAAGHFVKVGLCQFDKYAKVIHS